MRCAVLLLVVVALMPLGAARAVEPACLENARQAVGQGEYDRAVRILDRCLEQGDVGDEERSALLVERGRGQHYAGQGGPAMRDLNEAVRLDPQNAEAYCWRGELFFVRNEYEAAVWDYSRCLEFEPETYAALTGRGDAYLFLDRYEESLADFDRAVELDPENPVGHYGLGLARLYSEQYEPAIEAFDQAESLGPAPAALYAERGFVKFCLDRHEEALADCSRAIRIDPACDKAYAHRMLVYEKLGRYDLAIREAESLLPRYPESTYYLNWLAWTYATCEQETLRNAFRAVQLAERVVALERDDAYLDTLAAAYALAGRFDEAVAAEREALEVAGEDGVNRDLYMWCLALYEQGRPYAPMP